MAWRSLLLAVATIAASTPATRLAVDRVLDDRARVEAVAAADRFLDRYLDETGRVVRHDEGGDTVSEGQAYAMLAAVAIGDQARFDTAWRWAERNLAGPDGALAWRWADGAVVDDEPATDADLDAAHALALAARRFGEPAYREDAARLATSLIEGAVVRARAGDVLVAGPWAVDGQVANPGYLSPVAVEILRVVTDDRAWEGVAAGGRGVLEDLVAGGRLVPDWAVVGDDGAARPALAPGDAPSEVPVAGYDATRVPLRNAASCDDADRRIAARLAPLLLDAADDGLGHPPAVLHLDGRPATDDRHPAATVAAAAAAAAAGHRRTADALLDAAEDLDARSPTYFGAALVALGRLFLDTDLLGGCPP